MLRFRLQGQVHFLRARIKGVADELTPARYLVAVTLTRFTDANAVKRRQNPKQEAVSGEANGRATRRRCQTLAAAEITAQTPTSRSPPLDT